jgi:hypothetical protein
VNLDFSGIATFARAIISGISASFTPSVEGEVGFDTTSNQLKAFIGGAVRVFSPQTEQSFTIGTTTAWTGSTTIPLAPAIAAQSWDFVACFTDAGTLNVSFNDGTNKTNTWNASTTVGKVSLSTNNTFTALEKRYVEIGTPASSPTNISCTVSKSITAD